LKDTCGPESRFFWFGVIRLSRIAPARRRKAAVKTGSKQPTVTGTLKFTGSTIISIDSKRKLGYLPLHEHTIILAASYIENLSL
jgi:hypothetical protein